MYQDKFMDYPLQSLPPAHSPLTYYLPEQQAQSFLADFPLQLIANLPLQSNSNPYAPSTRSRLPTSNSNHSVSKWAFTEMSTQDHKQEQLIIPCFLQAEPSQKGQTVTEATFKPHQLQEHLKQARQHNGIQDARQEQGRYDRLQQSKSLRRLLANTLQNDQKQEPKDKGCTQVLEKGKTKYQKILDQFFQKPTKIIKSKGILGKVVDFKTKYDQLLSLKHNIKEQHHTEKQNIKQSINNRQRITQSHKQMPTIKDFEINKAIANNKEKVWPQSTANKTALIKTFSQPHLNKRPDTSRTHSNHQKDPRVGEGWMKMSFSERQKRTLQSRREKEVLGHKLSQQKQIRGCSFKPKTIEYRGRKPQQTASSYAKLYIEKVRRRT